MAPSARKHPIPVIDLFAGPGGLNEGFSRLGEDEGVPTFKTIGSFEMEKSAVDTLTLRATYRHLFRSGGVPDAYYDFIRGEIDWDRFLSDTRVSTAHSDSKRHVHQVELGGANDSSNATITVALKKSGITDSQEPWVLIGGPPCQAYSLAGRSRRTNDATFESDKKHFLYREYLRIIQKFSPPVFVMENVKGLLSSKSAGTSMFDRIKQDLQRPGGDHEYSIYSLVTAGEPKSLRPADFIIRSELYGVPQRRHRVILVGVRNDWRNPKPLDHILEKSGPVSVRDALTGMPALRSGISPAGQDSWDAWLSLRTQIASQLGEISIDGAQLTRGDHSMSRMDAPRGEFGNWVIDKRLDQVIQHETRGHMREDLKRYFFAANYAINNGVSPTLRNFPVSLLPLHKNVSAESVVFGDRFRVQLSNDPSTTVVSHISKDGHYYIHPDPAQMRSLTVREAARLQSFPDNYYFMGNRTQQYQQVGNAVPPLLATKIALIVHRLINHDK